MEEFDFEVILLTHHVDLHVAWSEAMSREKRRGPRREHQWNLEKNWNKWVVWWRAWSSSWCMLRLYYKSYYCEQGTLLPAAGDLHTFDTQHRQKEDLEHSCLLQDMEGDAFYPLKSFALHLWIFHLFLFIVAVKLCGLLKMDQLGMHLIVFSFWWLLFSCCICSPKILQKMSSAFI